MLLASPTSLSQQQYKHRLKSYFQKSHSTTPGNRGKAESKNLAPSLNNEAWDLALFLTGLSVGDVVLEIMGQRHGFPLGNPIMGSESPGVGAVQLPCPLMARVGMPFSPEAT